ncbi:MAG: DUF5719 family protein [Dermatophilaceae bacterium]
MKAWVVPAGRVGLTLAALAGLTLAQGSAGVLDLRTPAAAGTTAPQTALRAASMLCVGPELSGLKGAPDIAQSLTVDAQAAPPLVTGAQGPGQVDLTVGSAAATSGPEQATTTVAVPTPVQVDATGSAAPGLSAVQAFAADSADLRGLTTAPCTSSVTQAELIAGGAAPGRQERLVLANPGANEVTVDLSVLDSSGPVTSDAGRGIVVPGHGRTSVLLDAVAPAAQSPIVSVSVRGGSVTAALSDAWLDGSVPAGLETTVPATAGTSLVIPVVDLEQAGLLRLGVPGTDPAVASVRLLSSDGVTPLTGGVQTIAGRSSLDLPLTGLPAGTYALAVESDVPIVGAAMSQARVDAGPGDIAWTPSTPSITQAAGLPLPSAGDGTAHRLALVATGSTSVVTVVTRTGSAIDRRDVTLAADRVTVLDLGGATGVWVQRQGPAEHPVHGAILTTRGIGPSRLLAVAPLADAAFEAAVTTARALP